MKKYISRFHYLTQDLPDRSHLEQAEIACSNGANWIQYRCMSKSDEDMLTELHQIASICDDWGATLIVANHYHLLDQADIQGVHIEDLTADLNSIREVISDEKTLGASATSIERILQLQQYGVVDYCGYGPFAHTETKTNNYPLLGFAGYRDLQKSNIEIPIIAVGGIQLSDVEHLIETGIDGIAISSAINKSLNPAEAVKAFYRAIY